MQTIQFSTRAMLPRAAGPIQVTVSRGEIRTDYQLNKNGDN